MVGEPRVAARIDPMERAEFITIVADILEVDPGTVSLTDVLDEIDWDSLSNIGFIAEIDETNGTHIDADELAKAVTVSDLYDLAQGSSKGA
jgi:acyl carrier protein